MGKNVIGRAEMMPSVKIPAATSEQMRMAYLLNDKSDDKSVMNEKVRKVIELTRCNEDSAMYALHDCGNDVDEAVDKILDGKFGSEVKKFDEWTIREGKKTKKVAPEVETSNVHVVKMPLREADAANFARRPKTSSSRSRGRDISRRNNPPGRFRDAESERRGNRGRGCRERNTTADSKDVLEEWKNSKSQVDDAQVQSTSESGKTTSETSTTTKPTYAAASCKKRQENLISQSANEWDVDDWGGEEDWKSIPKEFQNSSVSNVTFEKSIVVEKYVTSLAKVPEENTIKEEKEVVESQRCAFAGSPPSDSSSTVAAPRQAVVVTTSDKNASKKVEVAVSQNVSAPTTFIRKKDVKVVMPVDAQGGCTIDVQFGEFGSINSFLDSEEKTKLPVGQEPFSFYVDVPTTRICDNNINVSSATSSSGFERTPTVQGQSVSTSVGVGDVSNPNPVSSGSMSTSLGEYTNNVAPTVSSNVQQHHIPTSALFPHLTSINSDIQPFLNSQQRKSPVGLMDSKLNQALSQNVPNNSNLLHNLASVYNNYSSRVDDSNNRMTAPASTNQQQQIPLYYADPQQSQYLMNPAYRMMSNQGNPYFPLSPLDPNVYRQMMSSVNQQQLNGNDNETDFTNVDRRNGQMNAGTFNSTLNQPQTTRVAGGPMNQQTTSMDPMAQLAYQFAILNGGGFYHPYMFPTPPGAAAGSNLPAATNFVGLQQQQQMLNKNNVAYSSSTFNLTNNNEVNQQQEYAKQAQNSQTVSSLLGGSYKMATSIASSGVRQPPTANYTGGDVSKNYLGNKSGDVRNAPNNVGGGYYGGNSDGYNNNNGNYYQQQRQMNPMMSSASYDVNQGHYVAANNSAVKMGQPTNGAWNY